MANTVYSASLIMTADVNQAKAQLKDLQQSLNSLMKTSHDSSPLGLTQEIAKATSDVAGLKAALQSATNVNTGKLDLSKFSQGLDAAKLDIKQVASSLQSLGPAGQQAFSQLATSIMSAEVPLKRTNQLLDNFKTTLANTVKWQISSSMVNSLVGAMQHAYGYAQDLNKSLNNIRIVTGYSTDQMSRFAKEANNAAKALSTTTTQYTDAALIYYQQGLAEKDIKARTDATIKMANVTGESAKAVSDYMTAIWNNFDNGSKSLEYYADVMTALGAATASSTDEIAAGLEKFAAVSETVGLSYEYATAALATVTAETRQSADVVGNAFKTLFSRIQGLNLGETMDDGTDLNKYSSALAKVGVDIKDTNGQIKQMDVILDELGAKWGTLSNDTQMALAQAVAGVRQYNQLISLMENWDTFKINLEVAEGAEGTLQEQADIYAESWQAAADRVEASFQNIYDSILNDKFFIKLTDFFGGLIDIIGNTIDGIGGMGGAFAALGVIVSRVWGKDIGKAISSLSYDPNKAQREGTELRQQTNDALKQTYGKSVNSVDQAKYSAYFQQSEVQNTILEKQKQLEQSGTKLTEIERQKAAILAQQTIDLGQQLISIENMAQEQDKALLRQRRNNENSYAANHGIESQETFDYIDTVDLFREFSQRQGFELDVYSSFDGAMQKMKNNDSFESLAADVEKFKSAAKEAKIDISFLEEALNNIANAKDIQELENAMASFEQQTNDTTMDVQLLWQELTRLGVAEEQIQAEYDNNFSRGETQGQQVQGRVNLNTSGENSKKEIDKFEGVKPGAIESYAALAEAISMCAMGVTSLIGLFDVWNSQDMSFGEKLLTTFTTLATVLPMIATSFSGANKEILITASNSIRASLGLSAAGASGIAAGAGATAAGTGFGAAAAGLWSLIWPIGLVIAGLTALVAIIYGISKAIDNSSYTIDEQIENSKKSVDELTTSLENAKTAAEELGTAFDTYDSAINKLEECTKGTKEYYDALQAANDAASELIKNNPELDYKMSDTHNGLIEIDPESQKEIEEKAQQEVESTDWALSKEEYDTKNLELSKQAYEKFDQYFASAFMDNGQIADLIERKSKNEDLDFGKAYMEEAARSSGYQLLEGQSFSDESVIAEALGISTDSVLSYAEAINKEFENQTEFIRSYMAQVEALRKAELTEATSKVTSYLGDEAENYSNEELTIAGAVFNSDTDKAIQEEMASYQNISRDKVEELLTKYVDDFDKLKADAIRGTGEDMEFYYKDTEGKTQHISAQTIADLEGAAKAFENIGISVKNATQLMSNLTSSAGGKGAASLISDGDLSNLSQDELNEILQQEDIGVYLKNLFGEDLLAIANAAGYDTEEEFIQGFIDGANNQQTALNEALTSQFQTAQTAINNINDEIINTLNVDTREQLVNTYEDIFRLMGESGVEALTEVINKMNPEDITKFLSAIEDFDWTQAGAYEKFLALLEDLGIELGSAEGAMKDFAIEAARAGDALPIDDLNTFIGQLETILGLINDLKLGDIVDQETIDQLKGWGIDTDKYFSEGLNGQYTMTQELSGEDAIVEARGKVEQLGNVYNQLEGDKVGRTGMTNAQVNTDYAKSFVNTEDPLLAQQAAKTLDFDDMTSEQTQAIFKMSPDAVQEIIDNADLTGLQSLLSDYISFMSDGMAGEYSQEAVNEAGMKAAAAAGDINLLGQQEGFYDDNLNISDTGREQLEIIAAGNEDYAAAYAEYQSVIEEYGETSNEAADATKKLYKEIKQIETNKAANRVHDLIEELDEVKNISEKKGIFQKIADEIENTFNVDNVGTEFVEKYQDVIDDWSKGVEGSAEKVQAALIASGKAAESAFSEVNTMGWDESKIDNVKTAIQDFYNGLQVDPVTLKVTGEADFQNLSEQLLNAGMSATEVANLLCSIGHTELDASQFGDLVAKLQALKDKIDNLGEGEELEEGDNIDFGSYGFDATVPQEGQAEMQNYTGGGSGGGSSDKADRDKLQDALSQTYEKKRQRLKAQYEGLDPESASKYIKEEIALLEEEQKILEEQIRTWKGLLKTKVQEFNQEYADELGFDLTLNDDGEIANLSEVYQKLIQMYDEGNTDLVDKIYKKLQESAGIQASIDEAVQGMMDKEREQAELELKDITDRIDWRIKQIDYQIKRLNYYQEKLLIQAHGNKQTIEAMLEGFQYQEQEMLKLFEKGDALRQGIDELNAAKAKYPNHQQMFNEQILEYQSDLIDVNKDILELRADMEELVKEVLELALDEIDIQNERINKYVSMLDRFQNIIDLSGRSILDQALKVEIGTTKLDTLINKMSISKQTMEGLAKATAEAQAALERRAADGDETSVSMWENQVEELERELEAAQDDFLANWEEVLQAAADIFDMRVELTVQTLEDALSPFSNLSILEDRYAKDKEIQDQYLDDATKLYELNKLNRQLNMSIQDENDLLAKSKLRDIQQEILAYQKAGVDMSQYDLDILQKKYDLRLAEIALMEAQNSKTSMRLIRDAAGNWTYAYDSDQNAIEEAIQRVEDATYDLQKATTQYIDEMSEELIAIQQDFAAAIGEVDRNASDYQEQLLYLQQHYMTKYMQTLGEFRKATEEAGISIHDTQYGMMMDLYNFEDAQNKFKLNSDTAINDLIINYKDWQKVVEQTMNVAGTSWESFGDDTGATLDSLQEHISALCDEISKLVDVLMQYVSTAIGMVEEWQAKYSKQVDAELAKNEAYINNDSLHQSRSSGGGGNIDYLAAAGGDYSLAMTMLIADQGQAGLNSQQFQDLATARTNKIQGDDNLKSQIGNQIITTENLINVLTDSTKSETALGSDVIASAASGGALTGGVKINYTQNNYQLSQDDDYESKSGILQDFINGRGAGYLSTYIPSPNNGVNRNYEYYSGTYAPKSGWCARWVGDVMTYNGASFTRGNAWDAVKSNGGTAYSGQYISNGTAVGSKSGEYGHIGIYNDGYIYATSATGNSLDRYTISEWEKTYGKLYITNAGNSQVGQTAVDVFSREGGSTYGNSLLYELVYGKDNNINLSSNNDSYLKSFIGLDTGGYTGEWGSEGRLAMLHEKELVLNKKDTPNILSAVKIARSIDDTISNLTSNTDWKLRNLLGFTDPIFDKQPIEQTVQINAEFPGVTDQYEIQEALSNLSNDASQYLSIKSNLF